MKGETINVASGEEISIRKAVETFTQKYNPSISFTFSGQEKTGDPLNWRADITMLKDLGFIPEVTFEAGVKNVSEWLKSE